jgi:hypothetical protein
MFILTTGPAFAVNLNPVPILAARRVSRQMSEGKLVIARDRSIGNVDGALAALRPPRRCVRRRPPILPGGRLLLTQDCLLKAALRRTRINRAFLQGEIEYGSCYGTCRI